jgi:hypothetical protein
LRNVLPSALFCLAFVACDSTVAPGDVALGAEFTLKPGESVLAGDGGLQVTFVGVTEDSRCPKDALCVWAGQVVVEVVAGSANDRVSLKPDDTVTSEGYQLKLVRVEPYPSSDAPIQADDYGATFVVQPVGTGPFGAASGATPSAAVTGPGSRP